MEQQYEEMQKAKKRFWRVFLPLLIYFGVRFVADGIAEIIVLSANINKVIDMKMVMGMTMQQQMEYISSLSKDVTTIAKFAKILIENTTLIAMVIAIFTFPVGLVFFLIDRKKEKLSQFPQIHKEAAWKYPMLVAFGIALCIGLNILLIMLDQVVFKGATSQSLDVVYTAPIIVQMLGTGILVPIAEEFFYRGVLYNRYRENGTFARAAVYSGILFAFAHGSMIQMLYAFTMGIILAYTYEKFGSILAPILVHASMNMGSIVMTNIGGFSWVLSKAMRAGMTAIICAFICSSVIVYLRSVEGRKYEPQKEID